MTQAALLKLHLDRLHLIVIATLSTGALLAALIAVLLPSSGLAIVFVAAILIAIVPSLRQKNVARRFVAFFSLLAVGDFIKRAVFLSQKTARGRFWTVWDSVSSLFRLTPHC